MIRYGKVNVVNFSQIVSNDFVVDFAAILEFIGSEPHSKNTCHSSSKKYRQLLRIILRMTYRVHF